jgi:hypothetical protein
MPWLSFCQSSARAATRRRLPAGTAAARKTGHKKFLELLARTARRENFRFLRVETGRIRPFLRASSSISSFSSRSFSSSRIWNQLANATSAPRPRKPKPPARPANSRKSDDKRRDENHHAPRSDSPDRFSECCVPFIVQPPIHSTQFAFFKQRRTDGQRRARITNRVGERLGDVSPLKRAFARFNRVGEPEKLPVWNDTVKRRSPPIARSAAGQRNNPTSARPEKSPSRSPASESCRTASNTPARRPPESRARTNQNSRRQQIPVHHRQVPRLSICLVN